MSPTFTSLSLLEGRKQLNTCRIATGKKLRSPESRPCRWRALTLIRLIGRETERRAGVVCFHGFQIGDAEGRSLDSKKMPSVSFAGTDGCALRQVVRGLFIGATYLAPWSPLQSNRI